MAVFVEANHIGDAWLRAYAALHERSGHAINLTVAIADPLREDAGVRQAIEERLVWLSARGSGDDFKRVQSMHTVANTIFPLGLYRPGAPDAAQRFISSVLRSEGLRARSRRRGWGTYIGRMVAYPSPDGGTTNQLQAILETLNADRNYKDRYEVPLVVPHLDEQHRTRHVDGAVLHGDAGLDPFRAQGGPCLAHISLTSFEGRLSMVALYRAHVYETRAYGNFLGLARLLSFLALESGRSVGDLLVVAGHAWAAAPGAADFLGRATKSAGRVVDIETAARPLGATMRDLDLPELQP